MPSNFGSYLTDLKNEQYNLGAWVWLVEIHVDDLGLLRLCGYTEEVLHRGETYHPANIRVAPTTKSTDGVLNGVEVSVSNIGYQVGLLLENGDILDKEVRVILINVEQPDMIAHDDVYTAIEATISNEVVAIQCGTYSLLDIEFPARRFTRNRCTHVYGKEGCFYDRSQPNSISGSNADFDPTTCDFTLDGSNGCRAHGDNEVANGKPRLHPLFFGSFPGIPKGPARV